MKECTVYSIGISCKYW